MPGPKPISVRSPAVAGIFYPGDPAECRSLAASYLKVDSAAGPKPWIGGIVPHAGWICSGAVAGQTIAAMTRGPVDVVVVFGAVHTPLPISGAALDSHDRWLLPGSQTAMAGEMKAKLFEQAGDDFRIDDRFHAKEHAVEVELPLIQLAWPEAAVLPIEVPTIERAVEIGRQTARLLLETKQTAVFLASSDLTHYGANYGFTPGGLGVAGVEWARANDRRLLDLVAAFQIDRIVPEVKAKLNACGGGAIAAMMAACREFGASGAQVLRQTNSYETLAKVAPQSPNNAVGYAAMVVG